MKQKPTNIAKVKITSFRVFIITGNKNYFL